MSEIFGSSLDRWIEARTALMADPSTVEQWKRPDWVAYRTLCQDFGGFYTSDPAERKRREMVLQRYMKPLPKRVVAGTEYEPAWSVGLHLAALQADREANPKPYEDLPEDDTMARYERMPRRKR